MGQFFSHNAPLYRTEPWSDELAELCLNTLQEKGFTQLKTEDWGPGTWNPKTVYTNMSTKGYMIQRNSLSDKIRSGFELANYSNLNCSPSLKNFLADNFAHHIMKCLLAFNDTREIVGEVAIQYNEVIDGELPGYDRRKIQDFLNILLPRAGMNNILLDTLDPQEQGLLSAKVAIAVRFPISQIDFSAFFANALLAFQQAEAVKSVTTFGIFKPENASLCPTPPEHEPTQALLA